MSEDATHEYQTRSRTETFHAARIRWADAAGQHEQTLERRSIVGASESAAVRIEGDRLVSRVHAEVELRDDGVWVRDLGSRNGTWIEGLFVKEARLKPGGGILVGATRLDVELSDEARPVWPADSFGPLLGRSAKMRELFMRLSRLARADAPVLVHGETGTGKELVARALHETGPRAHRPFVVVDCGSLPANLLESELFGHARGAFTGAVSTHVGAVEVAAEGTIFLDEIGELPLDMQPKLLRALESRTFRRVGETEQRPIKARFVAATHRDLAAMVNAGSFREDLLFRLNVLPVEVPSLRERAEDVPLLVEHMLRARAAAPLDIDVAELTTRPWPGNVRELRSFVERAVTLGPDEALALAGAAAPAGRKDAAPVSFPPVDVRIPFKDVRDQWLEHLERTYVVEALRFHGGNVTAVAEGSQLARSYVHRLIRKHELDR